MNELIINNRRVDLGENTNIGLTFSANNIGELQNRQGNFSNTFKLPTTKNNKEIFEWSHLQTSSSLMPYQTLKATYKQNGIEIVSDGLAEINNVDNNYYYVNVYSGNLDLMGSIGDLTVGQLYENDIVYNWNLTNNIAIRDKSRYYIYPLIGWRKDVTFFTTSTIDVRQMLPCAVVQELFNRLSSKIGYSFTGNYLNSSDHLNMILTPNDFTGNKFTGNEVLTSSNNYVIDTTSLNLPSGTAMSLITLYPTFNFSFNDVTLEENLPDFSTGYFQPTTNKIGKLNFTGEYSVWWNKLTNFPLFTQNSKKNGEIYLVCTIIDDLGNEIMSNTSDTQVRTLDVYRAEFDFSFNFDTPELTFLSARQYKIRVEAHCKQNDKVATKVELFNKKKDNLTFSLTDKIAFDNPINFKELFTMKVKDVLKDILNLRAIIIQTNNYTKTISFNSFEDVNLNKSIAKDWSNKIQNSTSMSFKFGNYAKKNNFLFKEDTDKVFNLDFYGDYYFNLSNQNLDEEKTVVKLAHPYTPWGNRFNGYVIPTINGLKDDTNEWLKSDWRLLNLNIQSTNFNVNYTDGTTTSPQTTFIPFCNVPTFGQLVPKYYPTIKSILESPKVIKIVANLNVTDISDLDFSIPIQIQRPDLNLSGYFYINKIENYKGNLTSCEIIEI